MSRRPGRWQRLILAAIEEHGPIFLRDLLPRPALRSEYVALYRASTQLYKQGRIGIFRTLTRRNGVELNCVSRRHGGTDTLVLTQPDASLPDDVKHLSVYSGS